MTFTARTLQLVAVVTAFAVVSLVGATAAEAAYPKQIRAVFVKKCTNVAKKQAGDAAPRKVLKRACKSALRCIEGKLTFEEFKRSGGKGRAINTCIRKTQKKLVNG